MVQLSVSSVFSSPEALEVLKTALELAAPVVVTVGEVIRWKREQNATQQKEPKQTEDQTQQEEPKPKTTKPLKQRRKGKPKRK